MKSLILSSFLVFSLLSCGEPTANASHATSIATATISVEGMTCKSCENSIKRTLSKIVGVSTVTASHADKTVTVTYEMEKVTLDHLKEAIKDLGYQVI